MKTKGVSIVYHIEDNLGCGFALRMRKNKPGRIVKTVRKLWGIASRCGDENASRLIVDMLLGSCIIYPSWRQKYQPNKGYYEYENSM